MQWGRPVAFGAPGQVIAELLDHVEAVERWELGRRMEVNSIRESLAFQVAVHVKAFDRAINPTEG